MSTYAKEATLPEGFETVLRDLTREILRDQPEDISSYGYSYFLEKMKVAEAAAPAAAAPAASD